jgi:hypothetical protein
MLVSDFPNNYEIVVNPELPGTGKWGVPEVYIPQGFKTKAFGGHLILRVKVGQQWRIWHVQAEENSQIWTTPDPERMLIAGTEGTFYVSVKDPSDAIRIKLHSLSVTPLKERGILLLNDYFRVVALDSSGIRWQTPGLFDDNMTIKAIQGDKIICSGFSLSNIDEEVEVMIDISTGAVLEEGKRRPKKSPLLGWFAKGSKKRKGLVSKLRRQKPHCACCGQEIGNHLPALTFEAPVQWQDDYAGKPGALLDTDFCVINNEAFFIRTVLRIPILDSKESLEWGVWVSLSEENFERYKQVYGTDEELDEEPYFGWFCNEIHIYPKCLGIKTLVHLQGGGQRPVIELDHENPHPLCQEQHNGITLKRAHEIIKTLL